MKVARKKDRIIISMTQREADKFADALVEISIKLDDLIYHHSVLGEEEIAQEYKTYQEWIDKVKKLLLKEIE